MSQIAKALAKLGVKMGSLAGGYIARGTYANIVANYPAANYSGKKAYATDMGLRGCPVHSNGTNWRRIFGIADYAGIQKALFIGGSGATYSQTGTTVTVTWTAHGFSAYEFNGAWAYLVQSTGALLTGWFTNFVYVDPNSFQLTSSVSQSTSGNLGTNTAETDLPIGYTFPSTTGFFEINDLLSFSGLIRNKNSGNAKTMKLYIGSNLVATSAQTTSTNWVNVGSPNLMRISAADLIIIGGIQITPANTTAKATLQLANSADWACCIFNRASIAPSS